VKNIIRNACELTGDTEWSDREKAKSLMFRVFTKDYTFTTDLDVQKAADAHLS